MMQKLLGLAFILISFFAFLLFSAKNTAFAATCKDLGGTCTTSSICGSEGNGTISGASDCTGGTVCCNFTQCNPPCYSGQTCVLSSGGYKCVNNCGVSNGTYCPYPKVCVNGKCQDPTCEQTNGQYCLPKQFGTCQDNGDTAGTGTCPLLDNATGQYCCKSSPSTTTSGTCKSLGGNCVGISLCDAFGIRISGATDCAFGEVCCKSNQNIGKCPVCPKGTTDNTIYIWDSVLQKCINHNTFVTVDPTYVNCDTGQICYPGTGCKTSGFTNGQLPCDNNTCPTALGNISINASDFVKSIFGALLSIAGGLAIILIIISGYRLTTSQGNPENIQKAREQLTAAIVGLLFIIFSFTIIRLIGIDILKLPSQ